MKSIFNFLFITIALSACVMPNRVNVIRNGKIPADRKVIMVPPGSGGILGVTKEVLSEKHWKMVALKGPEKTVGTLSHGNINISQYNEESANYILYTRGQFVNYDCEPDFNDYAGEPLTSFYRYSVSIVDWKNGKEVLTIGGSSCLYDIVKNLKTDIP